MCFSYLSSQNNVEKEDLLLFPLLSEPFSAYELPILSASLGMWGPGNLPSPVGIARPTINRLSVSQWQRDGMASCHLRMTSSGRLARLVAHEIFGG